MCDACLKQLCYDGKHQPRCDFSLYPYYDEGTVQVEMLRRQRRQEHQDLHSCKTEDGTAAKKEEIDFNSCEIDADELFPDDSYSPT